MRVWPSVTSPWRRIAYRLGQHFGARVLWQFGTYWRDLQTVALVAFPCVSAVALYRVWRANKAATTARPRPGIGACVLVATVLAYSGTWYGLVNQERWEDAEPWEFSSPEYRLWLEENGASTDDFRTTIVAGFPLQRVEGSVTAAAPARLLPGKGLEVMMANFLLLTAAFVALAIVIPECLLWPIGWAAVALALVTGFLGRVALMWLLD